MRSAARDPSNSSTSARSKSFAKSARDCPPRADGHDRSARIDAEPHLSADEPIYFICHLGGRSGRVCLAIMAAGYPNVVNVVGGTEAWEAAGLPVESG